MERRRKTQREREKQESLNSTIVQKQLWKEVIAQRLDHSECTCTRIRTWRGITAQESSECKNMYVFELDMYTLGCHLEMEAWYMQTAPSACVAKGAWSKKSKSNFLFHSFLPLNLPGIQEGAFIKLQTFLKRQGVRRTEIHTWARPSYV